MSLIDEKLSTPGVSLLTIGPLAIDGRAFLAPMAGISDLGMRRVARRCGASLVVSEMVAGDGLTHGKLEPKLRAAGEGLDLHVVQIAGCAPSPLAEAARMAEASGAGMIDINMGCPAKRVTGGLAGSALMRDLEQATALIRAVVGAVSVPVSVKMRLGWDDASRNAPELARRAEVEGVAMVTVHGRTRQQFYKGRADWLAIADVKKAVTIPVVANGDCAGLTDARAMLAASGADAVMIGRAALGRPWLVGMIAGGLQDRVRVQPDFSEKIALIVEHYESILTSFGNSIGVRFARKHLAAYAADLGHDAAACRMIVTSDNPADVIALLSRRPVAAALAEAA